LSIYFPKWFNADNSIYNQYLKEYILTKINLIIDPENNDVVEIMREICNYFINQNKPKQFNPGSKNNIVITSEKQFESVCTNLEESGVNLENITVFSFYSKIEHFEKRYNELKSHGNRRN
jgi:hypothetical protein